MYVLLLIIGIVIGLCIGLFICLKFSLYVSKTKDKTVSKFKSYFVLVSKWAFHLLEEGNRFTLIGNDEKYSFAIYGAAEIGVLLYAQLKKQNADVRYFIDRTGATNGTIKLDVKTYSISDELPPVDVVIISPYFEYEKIKEMIEKKHCCKYIYSAKKIIDDSIT